MRLETAIAFVGEDYGLSPVMIANIVFRFILNLGAALACWVPLRLFYRNRELAGAAMVVATAIMNFYYGVDSVIWRNNDIQNWFRGYGWCDLQLVLWIPLETLNAAAIFAVMQNIASQVSLMRASGLTGPEKRRKHTIQALIIFPIPALQAALYYCVIGRRYNISGIVGCQAVFQTNWVFLVFFILPCPIFAVAAAYFAVLTWWRYRQIDAACRTALYHSGNCGSRARAARARRKLYFMALTIVAPYCPMQLVFLFNNIRMGLPWSAAYNLAQLHAPGWNEIDFAPSNTVSFVSMYINYIAFLEVVVFFLYFGGTKDAHEMYRKDLRALGIAKIFPRLNEEWHPSERPPTTFRDLWPRHKSISLFSTSTASHSQPSTSNYKAKSWCTEHPLNDIDDTSFLNIRLDSLDLERATVKLDAGRSSMKSANFHQHQQGFGIFRFNLAPRFELPEMPRTALFRSKTKGNRCYTGQSSPAPIDPHQHRPRWLEPMRNPARSGPESEHGINGRSGGDRVSAHRSRVSDVSGSTLVDNSSLRLSDYERGLVSIRKDFVSLPQRLKSPVVKGRS